MRSKRFSYIFLSPPSQLMGYEPPCKPVRLRPRTQLRWTSRYPHRDLPFPTRTNSPNAFDAGNWQAAGGDETDDTPPQHARKTHNGVACGAEPTPVTCFLSPFLWKRRYHHLDLIIACFPSFRSPPVPHCFTYWWHLPRNVQT